MRCGAIWVKQDQNGNEYLSIRIDTIFFGKLNFAAFVNSDKQKDNQPDYNVVYSDPDDRKQNDQGNASPRTVGGAGNSPQDAAEPDDEPDPEDIPW